MAAEAIVAVLAGGRGRRMGRPKAGVPLAGRALVEYPLSAAREAGLEAVVVAKPGSPLPALDVAVWEESAEPVHPLCGVVCALDRAAGRAVVTVGCDMPFVTGTFLRWLADRTERLVVPALGASMQPLVARYGTELRDDLAAALVREEAMRATVERLEPTVVEAGELERFGDPERLLFNVNSPEDLARAERLLRDG